MVLVIGRARSRCFGTIDSMYQFSLTYFKQVLSATVVNAPQSEDLQERLQILLDEVLKSVFVNICRALFEQHKTLFGFMMSIAIAAVG